MGEPTQTDAPIDYKQAYHDLQYKYTQLKESFQKAQLERQQSELRTRQATFQYEQLVKEKEELILEKIDIRTALEELKAAQDEIIEKNEELQSAYDLISTHRDELKEASDAIHAKKQELHMRGIELRTALEELRHTQEQLILSEKMSSLGGVIANIAHEINTPIGAIYAASQNVESSLPKLLDGFPALFRDMPDGLKPLFFELVELAKTGTQTADLKDERRLRRDLASELLKKKFDTDTAEAHARVFSKIGIHINKLDHFLPVLKDEHASRLLEAALAVGRLRANLTTIATAIEKTQRVILSLKSYVDDDITPQRGATVDLGENLTEAVERFRKLGYPGLKIKLDIQPGLPRSNCYPDQLQQIWNHLLLNATQAMPEGGTITVSLAKEAQHDYFVITVTDTGPGIPKRNLPRVFDAFFTTRPEGQGSGLGLFVSRKIIHRHNGSIEVTSGEGGTTFTIHLPYSR